MSLAFTKMQACGNDFVVIDDRSQHWLLQESELARRLCQRRFGIGADGLLLLRPGSQEGRFGMRFINADGLVGEMCGNGARCLAAYLHRAGSVAQTLVLESGAGPVHVDMRGMPTIRLTLGPLTELRADLRLVCGGEERVFDELDVGPPHVVCLLSSLDALHALDIVTMGRLVRHHPLFAPRGCNVNAVAMASDGSLHLRTYERGVEDETLGCGTGAVAAAMVAHRRLQIATHCRVVTRSGETLEVDLGRTDAPILTGSAHFVADGQLDPSVLADIAEQRSGTH